MWRKKGTSELIIKMPTEHSTQQLRRDYTKINHDISEHLSKIIFWKLLVLSKEMNFIYKESGIRMALDSSMTLKVRNR